jgi:hypothetical protein
VPATSDRSDQTTGSRARHCRALLGWEHLIENRNAELPCASSCCGLGRKKTSQTATRRQTKGVLTASRPPIHCMKMETSIAGGLETPAVSEESTADTRSRCRAASSPTQPPSLHLERVVPIGIPPAQPLPGPGQQTRRQEQRPQRSHWRTCTRSCALRRCSSPTWVPSTTWLRGMAVKGQRRRGGARHAAISITPSTRRGRSPNGNRQAQRAADQRIGQGPEAQAPARLSILSWVFLSLRIQRHPPAQ